MTQIPPLLTSFQTRNIKEAATLYAFEEVAPVLDSQGKCGVFRAKVKDGTSRDWGEEVTWFSFQNGKLADQIHAAFEDKDFEWKHGGSIPDEHIPAMLCLIKRIFHNMERCRDAAKSVPLHGVVHDGGKIKIATVPA